MLQKRLRLVRLDQNVCYTAGYLCGIILTTKKNNYNESTNEKQGVYP